MPAAQTPVVRHGVAADAEVAGDAPVGLAQLQPAQNLADVGHRTPPSRHSSPPGADVLRRGFPVVGRMKKESGHAPPGGSLWPPLGGSVWVTLPGSVWATPGGSASPTPVAQYGATADSSRPRRRASGWPGAWRPGPRGGGRRTRTSRRCTPGATRKVKTDLRDARALAEACCLWEREGGTTGEAAQFPITPGPLAYAVHGQWS